MKTKICKICDIEKEDTEYYNHGKYKSTHCKACYKIKYPRDPEYYKGWCLKNPEYHKNYHVKKYKTDKPIVYAIYTPDEKLYIGQTTLNMVKRFECHASNIGCSLYEHVNISEYEFKDLDYQILAEVRTVREAKRIETAVIKALKLAVPEQVINIYN